MEMKNLLITSIAIFGLATISFGQTLPSYIPTNGLVGWWPFNGNANDESGNGNDGTVYGATLSSDRFENANRSYSFDGTGNYIQTTELHNQIYTFSVSVWAKSQTGGTILTGKKNVGAPSWVMTDTVGITLDMINETNSLDIGKIRYLADGNFFQKGQQTAITVNNNTWHHIVGVWNGPNTASELNPVDFSIFIDGQLASTSSVSLNSDFSPLNGYTGVIFGKHTNWQSWSNFNGQLDDIGIWNRALTQEEITSLYYGSSLDINEASQSNVFSVFPNPAQSLINVNIEASLVGSVFTIYDITGKAVKTGKLNSSNTTIEVNDLSGGIYSFSVGGNSKQTFKVIKE
jgi:hypothetical protein